MRWIAIIVVSAGALARVQPIELTPAEAFTDAIEAYSAGPFGEDITVAVTRDGQTRRDRIRARVAPGAGPGGAEAARYDLGTLHIHASAGVATAIDDRNPASFARLAIPGPLTPDAMARAFRPIPLPGWELIARGVPDLARPVAFTGPVIWTTASLDPDARPPVVTLTGSSARARLRLVMLAESGRWKRLTVEALAEDGTPDGVIDLNFAPFDPGPVEDWAFDLAGRLEVPTIQELPVVSRVIAAGEPVPELGLSDLGLRSWSWRGFASGRPAAIVLFRLGPGDPGVVIERAKRAVDAVRAGSPAMPIVVIGVIELAEFDGSTMGRLDALRAAPGPIEIAWTSSAAGSIERFAPGAEVAVVFASGAGELVRVVSVDGEESFSDVQRQSESAPK